MAFGNITTVQSEKYLAALYVLNSDKESTNNGLLQSFDVKKSTGNKLIHFTKMRVGRMRDKSGVGQDITADFNEFEFVDCPVKSKTSRVLCDTLEDDKAQFNEIMYTTKNMSQKIYNEKVFELVNTLDKTTNVITPSTGKSANLNAILTALQKMNEESIPSEDRHAIIDAATLRVLMETTEITSIDYNTVKALHAGTIKEAFGVKWHVVGNQYFGDLTPPASGVFRKMYIYHKDCIGMAVGKEHVRVGWESMGDRTAVVGGLNLGGCIVDELGVVALTLSDK